MDRDIVRKTWGSIVSDPQNQGGGSVSVVEIYHNGIYQRYKRKKCMGEVLQKALSDIFKLTKCTPMWYGYLHQYFGLLGKKERPLMSSKGRTKPLRYQSGVW